MESSAIHERVSIPSGEIRFRRAGRGALVVLLHTLRTQLEYFDRLIAVLDPSRFEVLAIDLPGHGESSAPPVDYTASFFSDAVEQVLAHCDCRGATILADSIGGAIGLTLAARHNPACLVSLPSIPTTTAVGAVFDAALDWPTCSST